MLIFEPRMFIVSHGLKMYVDGSSDVTKLSGNRLKMSDNSIRKFKSASKRDKFERVAQAAKHGFKPQRRGKSRK